MYFLAPLRCLRGLSSPQHVCLRFNPSCFVASRCRRQPSSQEKKGGWEGGWKRDVGGGLFFLLRNPASGGVQNNKRMGRPGKAGRHGRRKKSEKYRSQAQLEKLRGRRQESVQWSVGRPDGPAPLASFCCCWAYFPRFPRMPFPPSLRSSVDSPFLFPPLLFLGLAFFPPSSQSSFCVFSLPFSQSALPFLLASASLFLFSPPPSSVVSLTWLRLPSKVEGGYGKRECG